MAGMDMIPAPIMLVDTLNTAPATDGGFLDPASWWGRSGAAAPVEMLAGAMAGGISRCRFLSGRSFCAVVGWVR